MSKFEELHYEIMNEAQDGFTKKDLKELKQIFETIHSSANKLQKMKRSANKEISTHLENAEYNIRRNVEEYIAAVLLNNDIEISVYSPLKPHEYKDELKVN